MWAVLCSRIRPSVVYKHHDGEPGIPIILSCHFVESEILLDPLVFALCKSISLQVKCGTDVSSYA